MNYRLTRHAPTKSSPNRPLWALALLLALAIAAFTVGPASATTISYGELDCEPLVDYDVSGSTFTGPVHQHLTVYSNGLVSVSSMSLTHVYADSASVSAKRAETFNDELLAAGALELDDRWAEVADSPVTTVTVFNGSGENAAHNVFSFNSVGAPQNYQAVVDLVESFIDEVFAGE